MGRNRFNESRSQKKIENKGLSTDKAPTKAEAENKENKVVNQNRTTHSPVSFVRRKWMELFALAIAGFTFIVTLYANHDQNKKWEELNQPKLYLHEVRLIAFDVVDWQSFMQQNSLHNTLAFPEIKDGVFTKNYRIYSSLVFWNPETKQQVGYAKIMITKADVEEERKRLNISEQIIVQKRFEIEFIFKNLGQLPANNLRIKIDWFMDETRVKTLTEIPVPDIPSMGSYATQEHLLMPVQMELPKSMKFRVTINYEYAGQRQPPKEVIVNWRPEQNLFQQEIPLPPS